MVISVIDSGIKPEFITANMLDIESYTEIRTVGMTEEYYLDIKSYGKNDIASWWLYDGVELFKDENGHGTMVVDIINRINPYNSYHIHNILDIDKTCFGESLIEAIRMSVNQQPDMINLSLGTFSQDMRDELYAITREAADRGIVVIASGSSIVSFPSAFPHVISAGNYKMFADTAFSGTADIVVPDTLAGDSAGIPDTSSAAAYLTGIMSKYGRRYE